MEEDVLQKRHDDDYEAEDSYPQGQPLYHLLADQLEVVEDLVEY